MSPTARLLQSPPGVRRRRRAAAHVARQGAEGSLEVDDPAGRQRLRVLTPTRGAVGRLIVPCTVFAVLVGASFADGFFRDEFYYLACTRHLAWGYVDHPPFSVLLL